MALTDGLLADPVALGHRRHRIAIRLAQDRHNLLVRKPRLAHASLRLGGQSLKESLVRNYRGRSVLLGLLGRPVSATTVSRVAKTLDAAVAAFHRRPLKDGYKAPILEGVALSRKTGAGALKRPVLVALGLRPDGRREILDFRLAEPRAPRSVKPSGCHARS